MSEDNDISRDDGQETPPHDADGGGEQPGQGERTFTQSELQAIINDRLERERAKYSDYDDIKDAAEKWNEHRQAQMSELEKAQTRIAELEAAQERAREEAAQTLIRSAFLAEAAKLGATHPEDAYLLAELDGIEIDEGGNVQGVTDAVKALAEAGRLVMGKPRAPSLDGGAGSGTRSGDRTSIERAVAQLTPEEMDVARKMNLKPAEYAESKLAVART